MFLKYFQCKKFHCHFLTNWRKQQESKREKQIWSTFTRNQFPFLTILINLTNGSIDHIEEGEKMNTLKINHILRQALDIRFLDIGQEHCESLLKFLLVNEDKVDHIQSMKIGHHDFYFIHCDITHIESIFVICKKLHHNHIIFYLSAMTHINGHTQQEIEKNKKYVDDVIEIEHQILQDIFPQHILNNILEKHESSHYLKINSLKNDRGNDHQSAPISKLPLNDLNSSSQSHQMMTKNARDSLDLGETAIELTDVAIMFLDVVGFTSLASRLHPKQTMYILNKLFFLYDSLCNEMHIHKLETAGDCYIACHGVFDEALFPLKICKKQISKERDRKDAKYSALKLLEFSKRLISETKKLEFKFLEKSVSIRVGLHIGNVISGNIGLKLPKFSLFGDVMNVASRMESTSQPNCIQVTKTFYEYFQSDETDLDWQKHSDVFVKNKGLMETYICQL